MPQTLAPAFPVTPHPSPTDAATRAAIVAAPIFGKSFSDHMARATWREGEGWTDRKIEALGPLPIHPAAIVIQYAQQVFEGMKAYKWADGSIRLFRPDRNAARLAASARRMALPELSEEDLIASLTALVTSDAAWVPEQLGWSLYLRPTIFGTEPSLLITPANEVEYVATAGPANGSLFGGTAGVSIWVSMDYRRATKGGTGQAKTAGNYAASMLASKEAQTHGCGSVLFLDAETGRYVEELGGMNLMVVNADGSVMTPRLSGTILPGVTRDSLLQIFRDQGREVVERDIEIQEIVDGLASGAITELFACGTAAVVSPVGRLVSGEFDVAVGDGNIGPVTTAARDALIGIQYGLAEDTHGWMLRIL
ncbi:MAG: branched-chain amino acid aminotransferase [Demequinaceae bacterium]|nr:branched-chain amino acid aminotransferase [Demequinaceae bacterium]